MRTPFSAQALLLTLAAACGGSDMSMDSPWVDGFNPPPVQPGFDRLIMPRIDNVAPGTDKMWCQWVRAPGDQDMDVVALAGNQGPGGHHIVLYATTENAPVGTSRDCSDSDLPSVRFLGGIGGESAAAVTKGLPPGVVFRIPKGSSLMANVHYLNASPDTITGQGYIDLKLAPSDPSAKVATLFVNVDENFSIPAHSDASYDANCTIQQPLNILFFGNHMHEFGTSAFSELIHPNGQKEVIRQDDTWNKTEVFAPTFSTFSLDQPLVLNKGDVVHTRCNWHNDQANDVTFPREMCVGFGVFIGEGEIDCDNGQWPSKPAP